ncbi:DUF2076 domain-containing protein [Buchnera aphidicola]|uniref:DUF2076 domain-containing protein n=1 Tax=Buchnera aphidicola TaxID=9 RepID=UPI000189C602|nr:DUF2076 domain-containing protein [Buchnera aphidicola]ACL30000.1 hypothetical protein BUAPTUC7_179 [Buchnera aphidicola str. Tuc7 (Acyrthosiphon pisum)]
MTDEEKNLIENLFHRLKKTELNSPERDDAADELIQRLAKKQPTSSYYMAQTILIQETAIKKMSIELEELRKKIKILNREETNKKPSFLSNFFKKKSPSEIISNDNNILKKKENILPSNYSSSPISPTTQTSPVINNTRSSSFLGNALQTATGVAGGMILGNMLMNVFSHTKPEEDIFDTVKQSSSDEYTENNFLNNNTDNDLINYSYNESDINFRESSEESVNNNVDDTDDIDNDNFI